MSTPTVALYYDDDYQREMEATLLALDGDAVVLDRTVFYPRGGNQASDQGTLSLSDKPENALAVREVLKDDAGQISHYMASTPGKEWAPGAQVHGALDWERRILLSRLHTAQHMISRWFINRGNETTRVDINENGCIVEFAAPVALADALACVAEINAMIAAGRPVRRVITDGYIEIVVEDFDRQPCGGTHVADAAEIGRLAITRHKGNRLEITVGVAALAVEQEIAGAVIGLLGELETDIPGFAEKAQRINEDLRAARAELHALREEVARARIAAAAGKVAPGAPTAIDLPMVEAKTLPRLLKPVQGPGRVFVCLCAGRNLALVSGAADQPANALAERVKKHWNLSGGGSPAVAMCGPLPESATLDAVLALLADPSAA